jgi:hypothetical protein
MPPKTNRMTGAQGATDHPWSLPVRRATQSIVNECCGTMKQRSKFACANLFSAMSATAAADHALLR